MRFHLTHEQLHDLALKAGAKDVTVSEACVRTGFLVVEEAQKLIDEAASNAIPANVAYVKLTDMFIDGGSGYDMGPDFYQMWHNRAKEFPTLAGIGGRFTNRTTTWVNCPVCGEQGMPMEHHEDNLTTISCTNHACLSNGGKSSILPTAEELQELKDRLAPFLRAEAREKYVRELAEAKKALAREQKRVDDLIQQGIPP